MTTPGLRWAYVAGLAAAVVLAAVQVLLWRFPILQLPGPTGPLAVGTRTLFLTDPQTHRELVTQLWYPALPAGRIARYMRIRETRPMSFYMASLRTHSWQDAPFFPGDGPLPLLLFQHAWGGRRTQNTLLAEDLASHGYVVVSLDHPGNSARSETSFGRIVLSDRAAALDPVEAEGAEAIQAIWLGELNLWARDEQFVLAELITANADPASWLHTRLDPTRVGALGHSFGGAVAMRLLGMPGGPPVRSALNFDGWTLGGLARRTTEPVLFVYTGDEEQRLPPVSAEGQLDAADHAEIDRSFASCAGSRVYVAGTMHLDFTDAPFVAPRPREGLLPGMRALEITRGLALSFFNQTLRGSGTLSTYPEVKQPAR